MKKLLSLLVVLTILVSAFPCSADNSADTQGGASGHLYTFEELTGLSREDISHIVIKNGVDGAEYSTDYEKVITNIYNSINTKTFFPHVQEGHSGGWQYEILFFDKDNQCATYNISKGITPKKDLAVCPSEQRTNLN